MIAAHQVGVNPADPLRRRRAVIGGVQLGDNAGQAQQGGSENQRNHTGHIDLERNIGAGAANGAAPNHPFCVLHGHTAYRLFHVDHGEHHHKAHTAHGPENHCALLTLNSAKCVREGGGDGGENQQ